VKLYCQHSGVFGVVYQQAPGADIKLRLRTPRWRNRHAVALGHPEERDNSHWNLTQWTRPTVMVQGCRDCGPREMLVHDLVSAFEEGRSKYVLP
jgi:hypothetical protein